MNKIEHLEIVTDLFLKINKINNLITEENYKNKNINNLVDELKKNKNIKIEDRSVDKTTSESYLITYEYLKIQIYQFKGLEERFKQDIKIIDYGINLGYYYD